MNKTQNLFTIMIEKDCDGYFISEVKELPGCHTQAKTISELMKRTGSAISLYRKAKDELVKRQRKIARTEKS